MSFYTNCDFEYNPVQGNHQFELDQFHSPAFGNPQDYPPNPNEHQKQPFLLSTHSQDNTNKLVNNSINIPGWPNEPRSLKRSKRGTFGTICSDVLSILAPIPFLALGVIAARSNGRVVHESNWNRIQIAMSAAVTAFPVVFAAIVGRTMMSISGWKLERGTMLGFVEQCMGSQTLFGTIKTQFHLRSFSLLGLGLVAFWALSPLGGQSSLHILSTKDYTTFTPSSMIYLSTRNVSTLGEGADFSAEVPPLNALYISSLLSPEATKASTMDSWGNVKIPNLSRLKWTPANASGWKDVPQQNVSYSSLVGIPVTGAPMDGNTTVGSLPDGNVTFTIETDYITLDCYSLKLGPPINVTFNGTVHNGTYMGPVGTTFWMALNGFQYTVYDSLPLYINQSDSNFTPRTLLFQSRVFTGREYSKAYCNITQAYVEAAVMYTASDKTYAVTSMRESLQPHPPSTLSPLGFFGMFDNFASSLIKAIPAGHPGTSSATELYLNSGLSPFTTRNDESDGGDGSFDIVSLYTVPIALFEERLTQILNTYYIGSISPLRMTGSFATTSSYNLSSEARVARFENRYVCHWGWLAIFAISSFSMLIAAIVGIVVYHRTLYPNFLGYCSSLTRDNPYLSLPPGGSTLDGRERARLLWRLRLRLGDTRPEDEIGKIAFGAWEEVGRVVKGKRYE